MPLPLHHKKKRKQSRKSPRLRQHAKISTNCSKFRIVQHELSVESVDGNKMLGSYVTTCTGYLFTLGRILNWQLCVLNHTSCDNRMAVTLNTNLHVFCDHRHNIFFLYHFVTLCRQTSFFGSCPASLEQFVIRS